mgnify:CR=1 FL=1
MARSRFFGSPALLLTLGSCLLRPGLTRDTTKGVASLSILEYYVYSISPGQVAAHGGHAVLSGGHVVIFNIHVPMSNDSHNEPPECGRTAREGEPRWATSLIR